MVDDADKRLVHIVDDEDSVRRSLDFLLRNAGFRTERWASGELFLKEADRDGKACVLLDIRMPGLDGLAVQKAMTEQGFAQPVILLTGHGDVALAVRAMRSGASKAWWTSAPARRRANLNAMPKCSARWRRPRSCVRVA